MEQDELRTLEKQCIQGEPAYCTAACPFHVDVKAFIGFMARQDIENAFKVLEKNLPLPEILARICDHPCENYCIRNDIDAPVSIGAIERICVKSRSKRKKRFLLPPKSKKVGIWGSGISSLTAAWELVFKGYEVAVHDHSRTFGGNLLTIPEKLLSLDILEKEINELKSYGVLFLSEFSYDNFSFDKKMSQFDALYIGFDSADEKNLIPKPKADDFSLQTEEPSIFAGGFLDSLIANAAQGRKAATSIDRFLSNVSITAGREREGVYETRLSTDISRIYPLPSVITDSFCSSSPTLPPQTAALASSCYSEKKNAIEKAALEAKRCIQCDCSRCVRVCRYIESFKGYPGRYAREIYNNSAIVMGEKKANLLINSCSLCNLCKTVCPNDFSMADLCLTARQEMVEKDKMPLSAHEFALNEMDWASGESCFFARHEPGYNYSSQIFFPGCQLIGSAPFQVKKVYDFLRKHISGGIGFVSGCCGAPAKWAGRESLFTENIEQLKDFWLSSGKPKIITCCTSCSLMLEKGLEGANITSIFEEMVKLSELNILNADNISISSGKEVSIIDPCTARDDIEVQRSVRKLIKLTGIKISEIPASGALTECCGFGGLVYNANISLSKDIITRRAAQSSNDFIAYCAMCRDRLASTGKRVFHILDLFWPQTESPEKRDDPGFSRRHDNLAMAKEMMLQDVWNEKPFSNELPLLNEESILLKKDSLQLDNIDKTKGVSKHREIIIAPEVQKILEERYILKSDIEKVIAHWETFNCSYTDAGTHISHFINVDKESIITFYRPKNVCFWVEFRKKILDKNGAEKYNINANDYVNHIEQSENIEQLHKIVYEILNVWSHRMEVVANNQFVQGSPTHIHEEKIKCAPCDASLDFYKNHVTYLGNSFDVGLPQCKSCGAIFISESLANGKMAEVEKILEDK